MLYFAGSIEAGTPYLASNSQEVFCPEPCLGKTIPRAIRSVEARESAGEGLGDNNEPRVKASGAKRYRF